ncbi:MAG: membrane protein insertion efficiency factor YidD [Candidatus Omnitrophota bacterium]
MKRAALYLIQAYRKVSFLFPVCCKFYPSCSFYAEEAFKKYDSLMASKLSLKRLLRCSFLSRGGIDLLP